MTPVSAVLSRATALLPFDPLSTARHALLPPVHLLATTARRLEHALGDPSEPPAAPTTADALPVEDWPQLSYADAQSRLAVCTPDDLRSLLAYEESHGHRMQYTLLLQQRLDAAG